MVVDSLRIISNTNTQSRVLPVLSQIMRLLGKSPLPETLLKMRLVEWSFDLEKRSEWYRRHNGKVTESFKNGEREVTKAFEGYLSLLEKLQLVSRNNQYIQNTKYAFVFCKLSQQQDGAAEIFPDFEKAFFAWYLLNYDADALLLILDAIAQGESEQKFLTESVLRKDFNSYLKTRLRSKIDNATPAAKEQSQDRYRLAEVQSKQNPESLHKHLIPPRLEWMHDLGWIKKGAFLALTPKGKRLHQNLPQLGIEIREINQEWMRGYCLKSIAPLFKAFETAKLFSQLSFEEQQEKVLDVLSLIWRDFDDDGAMRVPYQATFLFMVFSLLTQHGLLADFSDLEAVFQVDLTNTNRQYGLRKAARTTESYLTLKLLYPEPA